MKVEQARQAAATAYKQSIDQQLPTVGELAATIALNVAQQQQQQQQKSRRGSYAPSSAAPSEFDYTNDFDGNKTTSRQSSTLLDKSGSSKQSTPSEDKTRSSKYGTPSSGGDKTSSSRRTTPGSYVCFVNCLQILGDLPFYCFKITSFDVLFKLKLIIKSSQLYHPKVLWQPLKSSYLSLQVLTEIKVGARKEVFIRWMMKPRVTRNTVQRRQWSTKVSDPHSMYLQMTRNIPRREAVIKLNHPFTRNRWRTL